MKNKFIMAWAIALIIPLVLFGSVMFFQMDVLDQGYDNPLHYYLQLNNLNTVEDFSRQLNHIQITDYNAQEVLNLIENYDQNNSNLGFVVKENNQLIYASAFVPEDDQFLSSLPAYGSIESFNNSDYFDEYNIVVVRQIDTVNDSTIYILRTVNKFTPMLFLFGQNVLYFILVILIFYSIFKYNLAKSIITPIDQLINMTKEVKKGNLDVAVENDIKDSKLKELINSFNLMVEGLRESKELRKAYDENQREFIMNITHDLKTPLTSIKLHVEALKDGVIKTEDKKNKYFSTIIEKTKDIDYLINEISLYSKLNLKKMIFNMKPLQFNQIFHELMEEIQFEYENKGVEINYDLAIDDRQHVLMDAEKIKRVILNTFENAYKYSKQDPLVLDVFVNEYNENFIKIEIADNGIGVNPDELNKIFDRFYREDKSRKSGNGGSGLGLSIASEIINNHEGKIWAKINEQGGLSILFTLLKAGENFEKITDYRG